jgi:xanthine/CO dehydrogenase XdhC/CoxF family maturation factor
MRAVWRGLERLAAGGGEGALVTVAHTEGSAYQREGSKLLFREGVEPVGTISGGCLEADLFEHCRAAIRRGEPSLVCYNTGSSGDTLFGAGTGCQGTVELLIEPVALWRAPSARGLLSRITQCLERNRRLALATLIRRGGEVPPRLPRLVLGEENDIVGHEVEPALRDLLLGEARRALGDQSRRPSRKVERAIGGVPCEILVDVIIPAPRLIVFGAGEDARPLVRIAAASGMDVTVADWRRELLSADRLPEAGALVCVRPEEFPGGVSLDGRPAIVLMTHNYLADRAALERLLARPEPLSYLGVLGPRARTARLLAEIAAAAAGGVGEVRTPAGLDLGADSPEEIALSIVAEVLAVRRGRSGRPLSELGEGEAKRRR